MNPLFHILILLIIDTILLTIAVMLTYHIWIKKMGVEIPDDRPPPVKNVRKHFQRRAFTFSSRSLEIIIDKYLQMLWKFDSSYWVQYCGIDAYIFLYFQRTAFKLFAVMSALSICVSIPVNVFTSSDEDWRLENLFVRTTLNNKTMTEFTSWLHVAMLVGFSLYCFRTIFQMKDDIREEYKRQFLEKSKKQNTQWLKAHTAHVIGLPQRDRKGIMLVKYLNGFLKTIGGRVLGVIVQPDFERLFRLEVEKKETEEIANALQSQPINCCFRCLLPDYLKDSEKSNEARTRLDNEIQKETETPFLAAGHAFVCFDSAISMQYCLQEFKRVGLFDALQMSCISCRDRCLSCFGSSRPRMTSTFGKYIEMDIETEHQTSPERYSDMKIEMEKGNEPLDVNWYNMADSGGRGFYVCRRLILNVCAVLILIFLSTPTVSLWDPHSFLIGDPVVNTERGREAAVHTRLAQQSPVHNAGARLRNPAVHRRAEPVPAPSHRIRSPAGKTQHVLRLPVLDLQQVAALPCAEHDHHSCPHARHCGYKALYNS